MLTRPTVSEVLSTARVALQAAAAGSVDMPIDQTLHVCDLLLASTVVRVEHEQHWMLEEIADIETLAGTCFDISDVTERYYAASDLLARWLEGDDVPLRENAMAILGARLQRELQVVGALLLTERNHAQA